jgi:hypothetical protein
MKQSVIKPAKAANAKIQKAGSLKRFPAFPFFPQPSARYNRLHSGQKIQFFDLYRVYRLGRFRKRIILWRKSRKEEKLVKTLKMGGV